MIHDTGCLTIQKHLAVRMQLKNGGRYRFSHRSLQGLSYYLRLMRSLCRQNDPPALHDRPDPQCQAAQLVSVGHSRLSSYPCLEYLVHRRYPGIAAKRCSRLIDPDMAIPAYAQYLQIRTAAFSDTVLKFSAFQFKIITLCVLVNTGFLQTYAGVGFYIKWSSSWLRIMA